MLCPYVLDAASSTIIFLWAIFDQLLTLMRWKLNFTCSNSTVWRAHSGITKRDPAQGNVQNLLSCSLLELAGWWNACKVERTDSCPFSSQVLQIPVFQTLTYEGNTQQKRDMAIWFTFNDWPCKQYPSGDGKPSSLCVMVYVVLETAMYFGLLLDLWGMLQESRYLVLLLWNANTHVQQPFFMENCAVLPFFEIEKGVS